MLFRNSVLIGVGALAATTAAAQAPDRYLTYDGVRSYVEVPASPGLSVSADGLTIEAWMRPDSLSFAHTQGSLPTEQYVHWLGKGEKDQEEWTFRMYGLTTPPGPRANRVSFYVFNLRGGRGCGSYSQDPIVPGRWMDVVGVADASARTTTIYKNGVPRHTNSFAGIITPAAGGAPLRIGSKDFLSFFRGAIGPVRIWNRPLAADEVRALYASGTVPQRGLVAQYLFSEGGGTVAHDSVGGHDGTLTGAAWGSGGGEIQASTGTSGGGC